MVGAAAAECVNIAEVILSTALGNTIQARTYDLFHTFVLL
jgi:hypothetical protein